MHWSSLFCVLVSLCNLLQTNGWALRPPASNRFVRSRCSSTQSSATAIYAFAGLDLGALFRGVSGGSQTRNRIQLDKDAEIRERYKQELLQICAQQDTATSLNTKQKSRAEIQNQVETKIKALAPYSPVQQTATSPLLQKEWSLIWTTEKEINFFLDFGLANQVTQTIRGTNLSNRIAFTRGGGGLSVTGILSVAPTSDDETTPTGVRTNFVFDTATLDLGWVSWKLPPVGEGWFDTIYLDETLRVDINSRDDILICRPTVAE